MCCFSLAVRHVSSTSIFARMASPGRQLLAYSMTVEADEELAMILPLPVPRGSGEDAVRFIDLSGYPRFFRDLDAAFPPVFGLPKGGLLSRAMAPQSAPLKVHQVGDFEASFVPQMSDFARLDPRFRIDESVWRQRPHYADHGFAVFKLRGFGASWLGQLLRRSAKRDFHPMALEFPTRSGDVFFPTVHIHDGVMHADALFDHALYVQSAARPTTLSLDPPWAAARTDWSEGRPVGESMRVADARRLLNSEGRLFRMALQGSQANTDRWAQGAS